MMKALLLFSTILLNLFPGDLPKLNASPFEHGHCTFSPKGKCIKASPFHNCDFPHSEIDTSDLKIVPHVHFEKTPGSYHIRTVVIDPGHGGHDPGCLGANSREKHIALAIGKELAEKIKNEHPGVNVIMTRSTDVFVPLHERAGIATRNKADLFISIHCNAFSKAHANGIETYVLGLHATEANLKVAMRENEAILLEDNYQENYGYDPNSPEALITMSMFQNAFLEQSISFAEKVQKNAVNETARKDRGVKQAGFLVLRHATMPSVLVETGYLTSRVDENYLVTAKGQNEMATAILNAFSDYKYEMENGTSAANTPTAKLPERKSAPVVKGLSSTQTNTNTRNESEAQVVKVKQEKKNVNEPSATPKRKVTLSISPYKEEKATEVAKIEEKPKLEPTNTSPKRHGKIMATNPVPSPSETTVESKPVEKIVEKKAIEPAANFCVQLAASPQMLDVSSGKWQRLDQTVEVIKEGSLYKYQIRHFETFESADAVRRSIRSKGFSDAFLVAYKNGQKVDPRKLK